MHELENQFISSGGSFKEYKIGELFEVYSPKKRFNANTVSFGGNYPYVVRTSQKNGVRGYITEDEKYLSPANTFSFGQDTATVFYQEKPYFTGDKIKIMKLKNFDLNQHIACYLISLIRKAFSNFLWGQNSFNEKVLNETGLCLPTKNNQPDFDFVEEYIHVLERERVHVLERERVHVLENYLQASGLDTYDLTDAEIIALDRLRSGSIVFKEYKIGELFEKIDTKTLRYKVKDLEGKYDEFYNLPALTAGVINQGLSCYVPRNEATVLKNVISVSANGANTGVMFYQPEEFTVLQDSYAIRFKNKLLTDNQYLYFLAALQKTIYGNFDWTNKAGWNRINGYYISLPTKNNQPDFDFMETYIHAVEKVVIKNVVDWKDKEIEKTKEIVA